MLRRMSDEHFRERARASVRLRVRYRTDSALEHSGRTGDLSVRGAFIKTRHPPPIGTPVVVSFDSPTAWEPLELQCAVRWTSDGARDGEPGFGVRFEDLRARDLAALHDLIAASGFEDE